jgi:methylated-DNA-[protein]-cysteine S-methyltransferase
MSEAPLRAGRLDSPIGPLLVLVDDEGALHHVLFVGATDPRRPAALAGEPGAAQRDAGPAASVVRQLSEYFAGRRRRFEIPLRLAGAPLQLAVWDELQRIPYGDVTSYGELAARLGRPRAVRAVAAANAANPAPIVVPCHRVIGADGSLIGYGGGLAAKRRLLELEGAWPMRSSPGQPRLL